MTTVRFILVPVHDIWPIQKWRATCVTPEKTVDMFFFSSTVYSARYRVRQSYPEATFSDEE